MARIRHRTASAYRTALRRRSENADDDHLFSLVVQQPNRLTAILPLPAGDSSRLGSGEKNLAEPKVAWQPSKRERASQRRGEGESFGRQGSNGFRERQDVDKLTQPFLTHHAPRTTHRASLHSLKILLENLPIFQALDPLHGAFVDFGFLRVFRRLVDFVEDSKISRKIRAG
jgi:hypothetical protein